MSITETSKTGFARLKEFLGNEVPAEMKKVSWPNKQSVYSSTKAVVTSTLLISVYITVIDVLFNRMFEVILRIK